MAELELGGCAQLNDSDFANVSFKGLWGVAQNNQGRNDLATIGGAGFNLVRLYNWGPSRQGTEGALNAHIPFLDYAHAQGLKVIVPVSNYFLGNDKYSWNGQNPDANYSFNSAPPDIRKDLMQFIQSITKGGRLDPAVESIAIGNEMDSASIQDPGATAKVQRAIWWVVNLQKELALKFGSAVPQHFLTIPISNGDQGAWTGGIATGGSATTLNTVASWTPNIYANLNVQIVGGTGNGQTRTIVSNTANQLTVSTPWDTTPDNTSAFQIVSPNPVSWFEVFANGAQQGQRVPMNIVPGGPQGTFTANVKGLASYPWYTTEFYNSLNMFQRGDQLKNTLVQYDTGQPSGSTWSQKWPGSKLTVPLFLSELGTSRIVFSTGGNTATTLNDASATWVPNTFAGLSVQIVNGLGVGQTRTIVSNTATQLTVNTPWNPIPNGSSAYQILGPSAQLRQAAAVEDQAQTVENVLKTSTNLMGYTIFEFNDEPNKNNITNGPLTEQFFGITQYSTNQAKFRDGTILYTLPTGETKWAGGVMPNYNYPVYKLTPVAAANGQTLLANLKSIFSQVKSVAS